MFNKARKQIFNNVLLLSANWFYRIKPSVTHEPFKARVPGNKKLIADFNQSNCSANPTQLRWKPVDIPENPTDFIDGLQTICGAGSSYLRHGYAVHMYTANKSMDNCAFCNADGDFLLVPQKGSALNFSTHYVHILYFGIRSRLFGVQGLDLEASCVENMHRINLLCTKYENNIVRALTHLKFPGLWITTDCGRMEISPGEVAVVPQGFRFAIFLPDGPSRASYTVKQQ